MVLLKPNNQIPNFPVIYFFYHIQKHQFNDLTLVFYALKHPVKLLREGLEHRGFLIESLPELANDLRHLSKIQV